MLVFDIETPAINFARPDWYRELTHVHCLVIHDRATGTTTLYDTNIEEGVRRLHEADSIGGHNVTGFDIPALQWLYPWFLPNPDKVRDSLVESEMFYPAYDLKQKDFAAETKRGKGKWIEQRLFGRHSLEAWGARLGRPKDDYSARCKEQGIDPWATYTEEMGQYCQQDVLTNVALFDWLEDKFDYKAAAFGVWLENRVAIILQRQYQHGVAFNVTQAGKLHAKLEARAEELRQELRSQYFQPFYLQSGKRVTPKKTLHYKDKLRPDLTAGASYSKVSLLEFNPASRRHIWKRLMCLYGWKPTKLTPTGEPMVDETVLNGLTYPPAALLSEYLMVEKRLGQLVSGNEAWLKRVREGRIHGRMKQNGTRTTRASHNSPNVGQVPAARAPYGADCRSLWGASKGRKQVGCDLSGIELRGLGHYLARYDGGAYAREAVNGDVHARAMEAIQFNSRDTTKTAEYAYLYGAGNVKLGAITVDDMTPEQRKELGNITDATLARLGKATRDKLEKGLSGLEALVKQCQTVAQTRKYFTALDGRRIAVPSAHSALNTLLQHLGGLVSKVWMVLADDALIEQGINPARQWLIRDVDDWGAIQMLYVHDELQLDTKPEVAKVVGELLVTAAKDTQTKLNLRVDIDAEAKEGLTWLDTH